MRPNTLSGVHSFACWLSRQRLCTTQALPLIKQRAQRGAVAAVQLLDGRVKRGLTHDRGV
jgi:hypothetical protein